MLAECCAQFFFAGPVRVVGGERRDDGRECVGDAVARFGCGAWPAHPDVGLGDCQDGSGRLRLVFGLRLDHRVGQAGLDVELLAALGGLVQFGPERLCQGAGQPCSGMRFWAGLPADLEGGFLLRLVGPDAPDPDVGGFMLLAP
jgi:hypothetical protein